VAGMMDQHGDLPPLNAVTILGDTDQGIHRLSSLFSLPPYLGIAKHPVCSVRHTIPPRGGDTTFEAPRFVSVCSPFGAITEPHIDAPGIGMIVFSISGKKLWFLWPTTSQNLRWMEDHNDDARPAELCSALRHLSGLTMRVLSPGFLMTVRPGTIHAVLSLEASSHVTLDICAMREFERAKSNMEWEIRWLRRMASSGRGFQRSRVSTSLEVLDIWETLSEDVENNSHRSKRRRVVSGMHADIRKLIREYQVLIDE
jgi:hypothetical protein